MTEATQKEALAIATPDPGFMLKYGLVLVPYGNASNNCRIFKYDSGAWRGRWNDPVADELVEKYDGTGPSYEFFWTFTQPAVRYVGAEVRNATVPGWATAERARVASPYSIEGVIGRIRLKLMNGLHYRDLEMAAHLVAGLLGPANELIRQYEGNSRCANSRASGGAPCTS